jgi:hypothetical protein
MSQVAKDHAGRRLVDVLVVDELGRLDHPESAQMAWTYAFSGSSQLTMSNGDQPLRSHKSTLAPSLKRRSTVSGALIPLA